MAEAREPYGFTVRDAGRGTKARALYVVREDADAETCAVLRAAWSLCNNTEGGSRPARGREVERLSEALTDWECEHGEIHGPHGWNLPAKDDEGAEPDSWSFDPPDRVGGGR